MTPKKAKSKASFDQAQSAVSVKLMEVADEQQASDGTTTPAASVQTVEMEYPNSIPSSDLAETPVTQGVTNTQTTTLSPISGSSAGSTLREAGGYFLPNVKSLLSWLWSLRTPLFLLGAIALVPKLILLWIVIVIAKPISVWLYGCCPPSVKARFKPSLPPVIRNSAVFRDLSEGADQGLPFILFWMYLFCAPFAIAWIAVDWVKGFFQSSPKKNTQDDCFVFTQNKKPDTQHSETNFYYSRAFAVVLLAFFALGIPAFVSYAIYEKIGLEKMMATNAEEIRRLSEPNSFLYKPKYGIASIPRAKNEKIDTKQIEFKSPTGIDSTAVMGYGADWPWLRSIGVEPTKTNVFFVHFYLVSLAMTLSVLFFRAWFLFPLNFLSDEHDVEFTESGIKRKNMKGWFLSVITFNRFAIGGGSDSLLWREVRSLRHMDEGFFNLSPLPETAFKKESLTYKLLNKVAALIDGLSNRPNSRSYLIFSTNETGDYGNHIKIDLKELSQEQRARLFYSVKRWASHVVIDKIAEERLIGSTVLRDNRYTQLWFDMLTSRVQTKRKNVLSPGEILREGEYVIDNRISSGGQATTYLATKKSGEKCVLKEFILTTSTTSGAMIESAREFESEVSLLSQLNHSGIVRLEDFFSEDRRLYVALEYIQGQSLRQKVQSEGPLSEREVVRIAQLVCDVLEYLHTCNPPIVHRDITPENILVEQGGKIKIIDFSLAVKQDGRQTTDSCAKQAFTPPEQFREEVCTQSDIYALGATMYFLLTGLTPKPISSSSPKAKATHVSDELNAIVERATQLDLSKRYESVQWLKVDLANLRFEPEVEESTEKSTEDIANEEPVSAEVIVPVKKARSRNGRRKQANKSR